MAEQDLDRNEAATPHKLKEAHSKGTVVKSADVVSAIVFATAIVYLNWRGWSTLQDQFRFDQALLSQAGQLDLRAWPQLLEILVKSTLQLLAPFFGAIMLAAIIGNMMQTGPVLSIDPITPDLNRINPMNGLKKLFSMRTLFDGARACIKLVLLMVVVYHALKSLTPQLFTLSGVAPLGYVQLLLADLSSMGLKIALMLGLIALVDLMYTRREFAKKMRMSRREMRDESKNREGDPRIRARLRELRREMLKRSLSLRQTRNADVVITNPTHLAIALRYEHGKMESPLMLAKGAGMLAAAMREIAARHHIPIVQNRTLARKLFHDMDVNQHVPRTLYADVARIMIWVFAMRQTRKNGNTASLSGTA
jgi:flagellar biosynthetic protein FlhB